MPRTTTKALLWRGARDSAPFVLVAGPFGVLFGVVATEAGLRLFETSAFSVTVFAGAAQFTALQLMQVETPTLIVLISALAVNLRCAMYSASLTPYLGGAPFWWRAIAAHFIVDQSYALSIVRFEKDPDKTLAQRMAYFTGTNLLIAPLWMAATLTGALVGTAIPESLALDFALPIAFLAMIGPMLRTPAHLVAALVSIIVALLAASVPHNLGLIIAGVTGMMAGAEVERQVEKAVARREVAR